MSLTGTVSVVVKLPGLNISSLITRTEEGGHVQNVTLPGAKAGSLTTRTDNDTGVATLAGGHGIITADVVDVFWATGSRSGMTATVATNAVTIDGGAGDVLPAQGTDVTVVKQTTIDIDFDGDNLVLFVVSGTKRFAAVFQDSGGVTLHRFDLPDAEPYIWANNQGVSNPLTGNAVDRIKISTADVNGSEFSLALLYNSAS